MEDPKFKAVEAAVFTPDQIKRRKLGNDGPSIETSPPYLPRVHTVESMQGQTEDNVEASIEADVILMDSCSIDNKVDDNYIDDSSKRYPNPDAPVQSLQDMMDSISSSRGARKDLMATATIDPLTNRIQLLASTSGKANLKHLYGFDCQKDTFLNPEEALYLMETGKLEICIDEIPISILKARALFLCGNSNTSLSAKRCYNETKCTNEEYAVFKFLSSHGYRLRRCQLPSDPVTTQSTTATENASSPSTTIEEPIPSTSKGLTSDSYTVVEVDSDVEFIDEVTFADTQVEIQEIASYGLDSSEFTNMDDDSVPEIEEGDEEDYDYDYYDEHEFTTRKPVVSTSENAELVDLVSSDDDITEESTEEIEIKKFAADIWSKFVPNSVVQLGFPPSFLLPKEIYRAKTAADTYEFNMKDQGDQSDLELEKIVDELKIGGESRDLSSPNNNNNNNNHSPAAGPPLKNWNEWRQHFVKEAHDIFNASLLGGTLEGGQKSNARSDDFLDKLNLWQKSQENEEEMELSGIIDDKCTFYLYAPTEKRHNKIKLGKVVKPMFRILIVRNNELVPDLVKIGQKDEENIPVLVAVVQDDYKVCFLTPDLTPITSLF